jgi:hypothetical protein
MRLKNLFSPMAVLVVASTIAATALAADVTGTWTWTAKSKKGKETQSTLVLKADGDKLTGATNGPNGDVPIKDGKITGKKLSFVLVLDFGAGPTTFNITGEMASPTQLKLHWEYMGMPTDVTLKKT